MSFTFTPHASHLGLPKSIPVGQPLLVRLRGKNYLMNHLAKVSGGYKVRDAQNRNHIVPWKDVMPAPAAAKSMVGGSHGVTRGGAYVGG